MASLSKLLYRFSAILKQISTISNQTKPNQTKPNINLYFIDLEKTVLKLIWNQKRPQIAKVLWSHKGKASGIALPDVQVYYKEIGYF